MHFQGHRRAEQESVGTPCLSWSSEEERTIRIWIRSPRRTLHNPPHHPVRFAEFRICVPACHMTVGDEESPDVVTHLTSAMQFAGFRSIIGTILAVDDAETNKITYGDVIAIVCHDPCTPRKW